MLAGVDMHPDQLPITVETVRALVDGQFPDWRGLEIERVASAGTVNALFRIGQRLTARLPLEPGDVASIRQRLRSEQEAARTLVGRTRFSTPELIALGEPAAGYPLPWSVQTWVPGTVATGEDPGRSEAFAHDLAEFITGVRAIDTCGRQFDGEGRGGDLPSHDEWMDVCFERSEQFLDVPHMRRVWAALRELPRHAADVMTHGDLIPGNVLVDDGRLVGVIDVGGLGPADPALDLVCAWHLFDEPARHALRDALDCDDLEWERGKAWAFEQAMGAVWYYVQSNPRMSSMGRRTLRRIAADG
jgi:aminoglycoside phosphotransferase (APT) family kinase protein